MIKWNQIYQGSSNVGGIGTEYVSAIFTGDGESVGFGANALIAEDLQRAVEVSLKQGRLVIGGFTRGGEQVDQNWPPIQEQAIPLFMTGKDMIGQAQTGTGKTAAFGIPILQKIDPDNRNLQAVILCPTRELAMQAAEELRKFSKYMHGIKVLPIYGGQDIVRQIRNLKGGAQIIVGTPGRVLDHIDRKRVV